MGEPLAITPGSDRRPIKMGHGSMLARLMEEAAPVGQDGKAGPSTSLGMTEPSASSCPASIPPGPAAQSLSKSQKRRYREMLSLPERVRSCGEVLW